MRADFPDLVTPSRRAVRSTLRLAAIGRAIAAWWAGFAPSRSHAAARRARWTLLVVTALVLQPALSLAGAMPDVGPSGRDFCTATKDLHAPALPAHAGHDCAACCHGAPDLSPALPTAPGTWIAYAGRAPLPDRAVPPIVVVQFEPHRQGAPPDSSG